MGTNLLFAISVLMIGGILISINYQSIHDFYEYSVPLNYLEVVKRPLDENSNAIVEDGVYNEVNFKDIIKKKDSECFHTPNNYFCYANPNFHDDSGVSQIVSQDNAINGEVHFDPVDIGTSYFTMQNMTKITEDRVMITFADKNYHVGNATYTQYEITDKFKFSEILEKFDTFIAKCNNYEGTSVTLVQYLGIHTINNIDYFVTWHTEANSKTGVNCSYPKIIQYSIGYDFGL